MEARQQTLYEAAVAGNVISLRRLLEEDRLVLDRYAVTCLSETPLHISAMLGHLEFTREILGLKPKLAKELDFHKSSPLHLAVANGHLQVVELLLSFDNDMCLAKDMVGNTPLHVAVIKGRVDILKVLLQAKPEAYQLRGQRGETILHLCVKYNQLDALTYLVKTGNGTEILDIQDDDGFTILHRAVASREFEMTNFLVTETKMQVNSQTANGFTALDIALAHGRSNAEDINIQFLLHQVGGLRGTHPTSEPNRPMERTSAASGQPTTQKREKNREKYDKRRQWLEQKRNALMVVASLIATMAFQAGVNPPTGVWQDDKQATAEDTDSHTAGDSIMASKYPGQYVRFVVFNTISFVSSLCVILLLISGLPLRRRFFLWIQMLIMWITIASTIVTYSLSIATLCLGIDDGDDNLLIVWIILSVSVGSYAFLTILVIAGHFFRLVVKICRFIIWLVRRTQPATTRARANV